ncbi:melatonin receptor type 1B-like [Ptychodera flava]|uniref:melatonin receptor type 1B-like n=1 Tax=Ptychodera flava TaxID=63121 RepID=UPI00396A93B8
MNTSVAVNGTSVRFSQVWTTQVSVIVEIILTTTTLVGNLLFIGAVILKKKLRTAANMFLVNLSLTDILAAVLVSSFAIDAYLHRGWRLGLDICIAHTIIQNSCLGVSLYLTAFTSINRYIYVVHKKIYHRVTNKISVTLAIVAAWVLPSVTYAYILSKHAGYSPVVFRCRGYAEYLKVVMSFYVPSVVTVIFYILIFAYVRKSRLRIQAHAANQTGTNQGPNAHEVRLLKVLLVVFFLVALGYLPNVILTTTYAALRAPTPVDAFILVYPCQHIAGAVNPILYGGCNKNFRDAYREFLTGKLFFGNTTSVTQNTTPNAGDPRQIPLPNRGGTGDRGNQQIISSSLADVTSRQ